MITNISRTITLVAAIITIGGVFAAEPVKINGTNKDPLDKALDRALNKHLAYPLLAKDDMTGEVYVSFVVDQEGKLEVLSCSSKNEHLKDYVLRKLARVDIGDNPNGIWKTTHMRIAFKPERT